MKITNIADVIYLFTDQRDNEENVTVILTEEGPVVIDAFKNTNQWSKVDEFIQEAGYKEPRAVIYTHWHTDHTMGNQQEGDYPIYGHTKTKKYLHNFEQKLLPKFIEHQIMEPGHKVLLPTICFDSTMRLEIGTYAFQLVFNPGHTEDSIYIVEEKTQTLFAGDTLMSNVRQILIPPPLPFDSGVQCEDIQQAIGNIEKTAYAYIIPGHGMETNPKRLIKINKLYIDTILNVIKRFVEKGLNEEDLKLLHPEQIFKSEAILQDIDIGILQANFQRIYKYYKQAY